MAELTAAAPRFHWDARRLGVGLGAALGLALLAFSSGGYFPTAWTWAALIALVFLAAVLGLGTAVRPTGLALASLGGLAGFGAWTWLAILWSADPAATVLEGLRVLMYVSVFACLLVVVRRATVPLLLAATLTAIFLAAGYGLLTRLFPERLGVFDPVAAYRLEEPLTYWNALGVFAVMGALLALGFAARAQTVVARALVAATLPILLATLYFTFSRGSWVAGAVGLIAAIAVDPRRLQLLVTGLVLAVPSALAVLFSSHEKALTRTDAPLSAASHDGHRLAVYIFLLALASGLAGAGLWLAERRVTPPRQARLAFAGATAVVVIVALLAVFVHYGGPVELARKGYDSFTTTSNQTPVNLNKRLFTFSGSYRAELWHAAWHDSKAHPVLGSGPGTYEQYWNQHRPIQHKVRDAHNLYLEVLAELGPIGLILLGLAIGAPLVAAVVARGHPLVPLALAAYAAFLVHATVDWDWEMGAVTLAALACAAALLAAADKRDSVPILSPRARAVGVGVALLLAVVAFVGVVGASALAASDRALVKGRYGEAHSQARKAARWWRWSPDPWRQLGDIAAEQNDSAAARDYYRKAISKDDRDWKLWYDLSTVTTGRESNQALAEARRLNRYASTDFEEGNVSR
jgi:O-antigen ligase/polysaccharide polymerase Wzy-like membrane protein